MNKPRYEAYVEPGNYIVRATLRQNVRVEMNEKKTESDLVEEILRDAGAELVDWEVS